MRKIFVLALALAISPACAPKQIGGRSTANLTAPGVAALQKTEAIKLLDVIRDTAVDGEAAKVIPTATTQKIVLWHRSAIEVIKQTSSGWQAITITSLQQLQKDLPSNVEKIIEPYIIAAISALRLV